MNRQERSRKRHARKARRETVQGILGVLLFVSALVFFNWLIEIYIDGLL